MGVGSGLDMYDVVARRKTFTFAISFSDELLSEYSFADGLISKFAVKPFNISSHLNTPIACS